MSIQRWRALAFVLFFGPLFITIGWSKLGVPNTQAAGDWRADPTLWGLFNGAFALAGVVMVIGGLIAFYRAPK